MTGLCAQLKVLEAIHGQRRTSSAGVSLLLSMSQPPCAIEGENCLCNGWVAYGVKQSPDDPSRVATVEEMTQVTFAVNDANNTKSIKCASSSFEMADPNPNGGK